MADNKFSKEQMAILLVVALFVFAAIVYFAYKKKNDNNSTAVNAKAKVGFSTPTTTARSAKQEKEEYKSQLDAYEEEQKKNDELALLKSKRTKIGFDKTLRQPETPEAGPTTPVQAQHETLPSTKAQINNQKQASRSPANKTQSQQDRTDAQSEEPEKEEQVYTEPKRRRLNSASQTTADETKRDPEDSGDSVPIGQAEIPVIVHGDQKAINNQRIRLRVTKEAKARQYIVDANQILTGTVTFHNDRIRITVHSFSSGGKTVRMKLFAYDNGELGIYAPTSTDKQLTSQAAQTATSRVRVSIPTPLGPMGVGGGAGAKKIQEQEKQFEIPSQYILILSDSETEQ